MKKLLLILCSVCLIFTACEKQNEAAAETETDIDSQKIYFFFSESCPHCHEARRYIKRKHPRLPITIVNVAQPGGYRLFVKCARKFKLGRNIGTPLFCMGSEYLMGWTPQYESVFDRYAEPFYDK